MSGTEIRQGQFCQRCGAWLGSLGLEPDMSMYLEHLVQIFRGVKRVLRTDGICWVNIGDSFRDHQLQGAPWLVAQALQTGGWYLRSAIVWAKGLSFCEEYSGSVMPESVSGTRWEKHRIKIKSGKGASEHPSKHPGGYSRTVSSPSGAYGEFVARWQDCPGCDKCAPNNGYVLKRGAWRPTRAHEMLFMLTKTGKYFSDQDAVREKQTGQRLERTKRSVRSPSPRLGGSNGKAEQHSKTHAAAPAGRNPRDVWVINDGVDEFTRYCLKQGVDLGTLTRGYLDGQADLKDVFCINPSPFPGAHFATFSPQLVTPLVKVSTSEAGVCPECGAQWARMVERDRIIPEKQSTKVAALDIPGSPMYRAGSHQDGLLYSGQSITLGWRPTCTCLEHDWAYVDARSAQTEYTEPAIVLDLFCGASTTGLVALRLGRRYIGIDLSPEYIEMGKQRIMDDMPLFNTR